MKRKAAVWAILVAGMLAVAGCNESAKVVKVQPPGAAPVPAADYASMPLPLPANPAYQPPISKDPRPPIDILVAEVQESYDAGVQAEDAGNDDQAQTDFDHAVKLIVKSGFQADADARLSQLFDELGEEVDPDDVNLALADQQTGAQTPLEPAPMDEIDDLSLPAGNPGLAKKAETELISVRHDLPLTVNSSVLRYLNFFTTPRGRAIVERGLERGGRYSAMIRRVLKREGLPQDLIYLAQAESAFRPDAVSRVGARGIWQFMPYRGEEYDLQRSYWVDERSDPVKATRAAAEHLRDLYGMFGDWYLVMAAYNAGPLAVSRAVERTGYADFWQLQKMRALPSQTRNYVPIIIALALVAKDPGLYGVQVDPEKPLLTDKVKLDHQISLRLAADAVGSDVKDLRQLNPELLHGLTPKQPDFVLNLPAGTKQAFDQNVQQVPENKWTSWRLHAAADGETLGEIARRYHVKLTALEAANHLELHASVPAGFLLNIPTPAPPLVLRYRVRRGDTLGGIARRFHVTVAELREWNHLRGNFIRQGAHLRIYSRRALAERYGSSPRSSRRESASSRRAVYYRVRRGDTLGGIARRFHVTVAELKQWNHLRGNFIRQGAHLRIYSRRALAESYGSSQRNGRRESASLRRASSRESSRSDDTFSHRVRRGETLYSIARRYQTSVSELRQWNPFLQDRELMAGDILSIER